MAILKRFSKAAFHFAVRVTVSLPRSHLQRLWKTRHPEATSDNELSEVRLEEIYRIEEQHGRPLARE